MGRVRNPGRAKDQLSNSPGPRWGRFTRGYERSTHISHISHADGVSIHHIPLKPSRLASPWHLTATLPMGIQLTGDQSEIY